MEEPEAWLGFLAPSPLLPLAVFSVLFLFDSPCPGTRERRSFEGSTHSRGVFFCLCPSGGLASGFSQSPSVRLALLPAVCSGSGPCVLSISRSTARSPQIVSCRYCFCICPCQSMWVGVQDLNTLEPLEQGCVYSIQAADILHRPWSPPDLCEVLSTAQCSIRSPPTQMDADPSPNFRGSF